MITLFAEQSFLKWVFSSFGTPVAHKILIPQCLKVRLGWKGDYIQWIFRLTSWYLTVWLLYWKISIGEDCDSLVLAFCLLVRQLFLSWILVWDSKVLAFSFLMNSESTFTPVCWWNGVFTVLSGQLLLKLWFHSNGTLVAGRIVIL